MKIKKRLIALLAGISLLCCGLFVACENPTGADNKDGTEITNPGNKDKENNSNTEKTTDKDKAGDKNTSSDKDKTEDKQKDSGKENSTETDENNEKENAGEGDINGKENGGESEGEESDVAEETTLSIGDSSIVVKNTAEGIRFEWDKLPEDTAFVKILTWFDEIDQFYSYAEIDNPSSEKPFVDEYVNKGETYKYKLQIFDSNSKLLNSSSDNEFSIKAKGGKGEIPFTVEATSEGIKISGEKQLEENYIGFMKSVKEDRSYESLIGLNCSGKSFEYLDKNVDDGEDYEYSLFEVKDNKLIYVRYKKQSIKATGGSGTNRIKLNASASDKGIKFQWENTPTTEDISKIWVCLDTVDSKDYIDIELRDSSVTSFTAENIDSGKSYNCYMHIYQKNGISLWSNRVTVEASAGRGEARLTNSPAATFDGIETINFTTVPTVSLSSDTEWSCGFIYNDDLGTENAGHMYSYSNKGSSSVTIDKVRKAGTWRLKCYTLYFDLDDCSYRNHFYDISELNGIPNPIVLSDENRFTFTATPVSDGIKLEWKNLPEGTKHIAIFPQSEKQAKFLVHNLADIHYVIDKHVEAGKKYSYCLSLRNEEGLEFGDSRYSGTIIATAGLGEAEDILTATASNDGIHLSVTKPASGYSIWIEKTTAENPDIRKEWFDTNKSDIPDSVTEINFTDTFVTAGKEYIYKATLEPDSYQDKDIIEILHYKPVTVKSISTGEKLVITNQPAGTYDEATKKLTLTTKPEITPVDGIDSWDISLDYNRQSGASSGYGIFEIKETTDTREAWSGAGSGMYYLCAYRIWLYFDNYIRYHVENSDISNLSGLPQSVKL